MRNEALEKRVRASPDEAAAYLVYADWLQSQGDRHGEFVVACCAAESSTGGRRATLVKAVRELWGPVVAPALARKCAASSTSSGGSASSAP